MTKQQILEDIAQGIVEEDVHKLASAITSTRHCGVHADEVAERILLAVHGRVLHRG